MRQNDRRRRLFKTFTACLLAVAMLLSNVGAMDVWAATVPAPTIGNVFIGDTTVSGGNLHRDRVGGKTVRATVHVTLKDKNDNVKAEVSVTPTSGTTWTVNLPANVEVAEGDTVTAYQELNGNKSPVTDPVESKPSLAGQNKDKLNMPTGEIWIEQTSSNIVNEDEQAEAVQKLKDANTAIAKDIKSVKFSIEGTNHAYYEVTYTDDSTSGKIEAPNLKIKQVEEHSRGATLGSITIVDNVIKGQLAGKGPFGGIKVQLVLKLSEAVKGSYCDKGKCLVDKDSSDPVDATVNGTTGEFTYTIPNPDLKLDQVVGVTVKEPHKFKSCAKTTVIAPIPEKTDVKDPRKLTAKDKEAIDAAIRTAYIVNGVSKLPNGTGNWDGVPAVIQIDDSGNVKIFSGNDVKGTWDPNNDYKFVPEKNEDGSVKVNDGAQPTATILAKDLVKNIKPEAPTVALSGDKKNITITPNKVDTDAKTITVSYKDKNGKDQTTTATKGDDGTWSIAGEGKVANGVITLPKNKVKGGTVVSATVTDKGGVADDDKDPLTSDPGTIKVLSKAEQINELGGLDPVDIKKWVGDTVDWKNGVKAKDDAKKDEVEELLKGAKFEDVTEEKRSTSKEGDFTGKIKVTFDDGSFIEVDKQNLYVSNHVTSMERKDKVPTDALDVEFKLGEGTKVNNVGSGAVEGNKDTPTPYQKYKVRPNTNLETYKLPLPGISQSIVESIKLSAQEGYVDPVWNTKNFIATKDNKTFTATATQTFTVKVLKNDGQGTDFEKTVKKDGTYTLPEANTFQPPNDNQEFSGWQVGTDTKNLKNPGETITITADTEVKAIWKPVEFKVDFKAGEGALGKMDDVTVTKGSDYELPTPTFTPPENKEFAGWKVGDQDGVKQAKEKIQITGNVTLTATWKGIPVEIAFDKGDGTGTMDKKTADKGSMYKLPESKFMPPAGKVFAGWMIGDSKEVKAVGTEIKIYGPIKLIAAYKDAPKSGRGSGFWFVPAPAEPEKEIGRHDRYLYGYEDKRVRPEGNITRAEAAALIARLAELDMSDKSKPDFVDTPSAWYNSAINIMVKKDLMFGDKNGNFRPAEPITRGEFARALLYIDATNDKVAPFADVKGHQFEAAINQAYGNNRISGYPDGTFRPDAYIQRAEAARILNQYANRGTTLEGMAPVAKDLIQFTDINPSHWAYCEVMEAANTHEYERVKGTQAETWLRILHDEMKR